MDRVALINLVNQVTNAAITSCLQQQRGGALPSGATEMLIESPVYIEYSEDGTRAPQFSATIRPVLNWHSTVMPAIEALHGTEPWKQLVNNGVSKFHLENHVQNRAHTVLNQETHEDAVIERMIANLLDAPANYSSVNVSQRLELSGLVLPNDPLEVAVYGRKVLLRRPDVHDLRRESFRDTHYQDPLYLPPDAIAKFVDPFPTSMEAWAAADRVRALLRLVTGANIHVQKTIISGIGFMGPFTNPSFPLERHLRKDRWRLRENNKAGFLETWSLLDRSLKDTHLSEEQTRVDHIAVAYQRFCEALSGKGLPERRIAAAVMGLESLFMDDKDLIGYKLSLRIPALLGLAGYAPAETRLFIKNAYAIRSKYVHGDSLKDKEVRKYAEPHGGLDAMPEKCLQLLRSAFIACLCKMPDKSERIDQIDNSMLDPDERAKLVASVAEILQLVGPQTGRAAGA